MSRQSRHQRETLRSSFQPGRLRLLFIGESPPASGRFFYQRDSGLYRAMRDTFRLVIPAIDDRNFLATFQAAGCYLIDLCLEPVDRLDAKARRIACRDGERSLSRRILQLQPLMIATMLRSIESNVSRAALNANWRGPCIHLPYPGRWRKHREVFSKALAPIIYDLLRDNI